MAEATIKKMGNGYIPHQGLKALHNRSLAGAVKLFLFKADHDITHSDTVPVLRTIEADFTGYESQDLNFSSPTTPSAGGFSESTSDVCTFVRDAGPTSNDIDGYFSIRFVGNLQARPFAMIDENESLSIDVRHRLFCGGANVPAREG